MNRPLAPFRHLYLSSAISRINLSQARYKYIILSSKLSSTLGGHPSSRRHKYAYSTGTHNLTIPAVVAEKTIRLSERVERLLWSIHLGQKEMSRSAERHGQSSLITGLVEMVNKLDLLLITTCAVKNGIRSTVSQPFILFAGNAILAIALVGYFFSVDFLHMGMTAGMPFAG